MMTNLFTDDLEATRALFEGLLGFEVEFAADWFVSLKAPGGGKLGVIKRDSEFIPPAYQQSCQGVMITVVVDDVEFIHQQVKRLNLQVVEPPRDLPYGQRRLLLRDQSGALIDVSAPTAPVDPRFT